MKDYGRQSSEHVSVGNWILTFILMAIPGINLIAGLCYLCSKKKTKRNYILAMIILCLIFIVLIVAAYFILRQFAPDALNTVLDPIREFMTGIGINPFFMLTA